MVDRRNLREIVELDFRERVLSEDLIAESTERHCDMYKATDGKWYVELAAHEYGDHSEADTYGPFVDQAACVRHLDNFSNPGGWGEDDSGTRPVPTQSPNGNPVRSGRAGSSHSRFPF